MAHQLGLFFKYLAAGIIFTFSVTLGYSFFSAISPPDKPWLSGTALGLTEVGLILWLAVFVLTRHHNAHKVLALIMIFACLIAVVVTDVAELMVLFSAHGLLKENPWISTVVFYVLILMFCAHLLAFIAGFLIDYFTRYPFFSHHGPARIVEANPAISLQQLQAMQSEISTRIQEITSHKDGEAAGPLALPVAAETMTLAQVASTVKEGVNTLTNKAKNSISSSRKQVKVPGKTKATTSENS